MRATTFKIHLAKETFKFSCSHFTILSADRAERLHGHNYLIQVELSVAELKADLGMAFDFNEVKPFIKNLCDDLDEYVLLPERSPHLKIAERGPQVEVQFGKKFYSFPMDDIQRLPIYNVTSEELARLLAERLAQALSGLSLRQLRVSVQETSGQSVSFSIEFDR